MFSCRNIFTNNCNWSLSALLTLIIILGSGAVSYAQGLNGVNTTGTSGNEEIQGRIYFPRGHASAMRPVIKLQGDSSTELTAVTNVDGTFRFTHLRPDFYRIKVIGGSEYEDAFETVTIGSAGPVPAQGTPSEYAVPFVYQVQIYLQPKKGLAAASNSDTRNSTLANVTKPARDLFNQGLEAARLGDNRKSIEWFRQAISKAPDFALAYNEMGVEYLKLGQPDKAAEAFKKALELAPEDFVARLNYGIALLNLNKFAEAEKQLQQASQKNPSAATSHYYLALALMKQQKLPAAEAEFKLSIKNSNDQIASAHKYLGGIYWHNRQFSLAADELTRYVALDPKAPDAAKIRDTIKDLRAAK